MTNQAEKLKSWLGRARLTNERLKPYEQAAADLGEAVFARRILTERDRLRALEHGLRRETQTFLDTADITPRQFSVLALHYLEYQSWTHISERLNIDRRYALTVHAEAMERLAVRQPRSA